MADRPMRTDPDAARPGRGLARRELVGALAAGAAVAASAAQAVAAPAVAAPAVAAPVAQLTTDEFRLPWSEPGVEIYVRNKRPAGTERFPGDRILLYVHGSTYPSSTAFDLPLGGMSAMDYLAGLGFDVYCVDLPGYGLSGRPAAMDAPPADNPPLMRTPDAAKVVGQVVDFIRKRRNVEKIDLMGWS